MNPSLAQPVSLRCDGHRTTQTKKATIVVINLEEIKIESLFRQASQADVFEIEEMNDAMIDRP